MMEKNFKFKHKIFWFCTLVGKHEFNTKAQHAILCEIILIITKFIEYKTPIEELTYSNISKIDSDKRHPDQLPLTKLKIQCLNFDCICCTHLENYLYTHSYIQYIALVWAPF